MVVAVIQPTKFNAVREALEKMEAGRMTICDGQGFSRHTERKEDFRGHAYHAKLLRKVILEVIVNEDFLERTVETIASVARTGPEGGVGDGKIFVLPVEQAIQINDDQRGPGAV